MFINNFIYNEYFIDFNQILQTLCKNLYARTQTQKKLHHHVIDPKEGPLLLLLLLLSGIYKALYRKHSAKLPKHEKLCTNTDENYVLGNK